MTDRHTHKLTALSILDVSVVVSIQALSCWARQRPNIICFIQLHCGKILLVLLLLLLLLLVTLATAGAAGVVFGCTVRRIQYCGAIHVINLKNVTYLFRSKLHVLSDGGLIFRVGPQFCPENVVRFEISAFWRHFGIFAM